MLTALKRQLVGGNFVLFGDRANGAARYTRRNDARRNIAGDHAASPDDRAFSNGDAAADHRVGTDPYIVLQADGFGGVDTVRTLAGIKGMSGAAEAYARGDKRACTDVDGRGIQNHAVIVDNRQAVGMNIEAVIAVKAGLDKGQRVAGAKQFSQNVLPLLLLVGSGAVVFPAKPLRFFFQFRRDGAVLRRIPFRGL